jgi:hypothetical protein
VFVLALMTILLDRRKDERTRALKLILALCVFVACFYVALIAPFGGFFKYLFPVFGLMAVVVVAFVQRLGRAPLDYRIAAACLGAGFLLDAIWFRDDVFKSETHLKVIAAVVVAGVLVSLLLAQDRRGRILSVVASCAVVFAIGFQAGLSRVQAVASTARSTTTARPGSRRPRST